MAGNRTPAFWQARGPISTALQPLAYGFRGLAAIRRIGYGQGLLPVQRLSVPVVVVGNLAVGGAGKTPLVIWLVERARSLGYQPGVINMSMC
ncbi:MAG: tetraacyldisaccharide 4'-kinase [Desulfohalobium sp.]